jgi:hypothetical protein
MRYSPPAADNTVWPQVIMEPLMLKLEGVKLCISEIPRNPMAALA